MGTSWRKIPWGELYSSTARAPWDSRRAFHPALRNSMDCTTALGQLETWSRLQPGILHGAGKSINPYRLQTVGGLASITQAQRRKDKPVEAGKCPFCRRGPVDSLQHAIHECPMDEWQEHCGWAKEAVVLIRDRFLASTMTAMLELTCPISRTTQTRPQTNFSVDQHHLVQGSTAGSEGAVYSGRSGPGSPQMVRVADLCHWAEGDRGPQGPS